MLGEIGRLMVQLGATIAALEMANQQCNQEIQQLKTEKDQLKTTLEMQTTEIERLNAQVAAYARADAEASIDAAANAERIDVA